MSTHALPSSRTAKDAILDILGVLKPATQIFDGKVNDNEIIFDPDQTVRGYAVLFAGTGSNVTARLCRTPDSRFLPFQITAVGGTTNKALWVADRVLGVVVGARLTIPDGVTTPVDMDEGDVGPVQKDEAVNPPRFWLPLLFTCRLANK